MTDIPTISFRVLIKMVKKLGFEPMRQKGSHIRFSHPDGRKTTIPDHGNQDVSRSFVSTFARSHVPTFARSHVPTFSRSNVPTCSRSHVLTFSRSHVPTFPRAHVLTSFPSKRLIYVQKQNTLDHRRHRLLRQCGTEALSRYGYQRDPRFQP